MNEADDVRKQLEELLLRVEQKSKLKMDDKQKKSLLDHLSQMVMRPQYRGKMKDPEFLKKITGIMIISVCMSKPGEFDKFIEDLKKVMLTKTKSLDILFKRSPKEIDEFIQAHFRKYNDKNNQLKPLFLQLADQLIKKLEKNFGIKLEPKMREQIAEDLYINKTGLITTAIAGGHQVTIQSNMGNQIMIPDFNPNHGMANLDNDNKTADSQFGDSLGLNAITERRYSRITGFASELVQDFQESRHYQPETPKPDAPRPKSPIDTKPY